jgi:hydrogenase-4 component H
MRYPKLRELKEAIWALIKGPVTTDFPKKPHIPFPGFRGKPVPDETGCIACGACAQVCPARAIEIKENGPAATPTREVIWHYDLCIYCGQCERLCSTQKGVKLSLEYDLATAVRSVLFMKVEKELVVCEDCGTIIAPRAQLLWLIAKLGPLASGNFNLIYSAQKELHIADGVTAGLPSAATSRADLYRVLCPKCRHVALVFNQTGKAS